MRFLKNNKWVLYAAVFLPLFFFYFDKTIILWIRNYHKNNPRLHDFLWSLDPYLDFIVNGGTFIAGALILCLAGCFFKTRLYETGKTLFIGLVTAGISVQILKHLLGRVRPRRTDETIFIGPTLKSHCDSFPSGHTTMAFALAVILAQYFPRYRIVFYIFAVLIGLHRIENIAHFPSDIIGGAILGFVVGKIIFAKIETRPGSSRYIVKT